MVRSESSHFGKSILTPNDPHMPSQKLEASITLKLPDDFHLMFENQFLVWPPWSDKRLLDLVSQY